MRSLTIIPAALAMVASPALAQSADAGSQASNAVNVVAIAGDTGSSRVHQSGSLYTTPNVMGSSIIGSNQCMVGTGIGGAAGPIGLNISIGKSDKSCVRRLDAAAFNAMGMRPVAIALLCQSKDSADAFFSATGLACPGTDRSRYKLEDGSLAPYWNGE